jgi:hypothetical protein
VRCNPEGREVTATEVYRPFVVFGRYHNMILETIKSGDLDALQGDGQ